MSPCSGNFSPWSAPAASKPACVSAASGSQVKLCQVGCKSQPLRLDYTGIAAPGPGDYLAVNAFISPGHPPCRRGIYISWSCSLGNIQVWGCGLSHSDLPVIPSAHQGKLRNLPFSATTNFVATLLHRLMNFVARKLVFHLPSSLRLGPSPSGILHVDHFSE